MSAGEEQAQQPAPTKRKRSGLEKFTVWGGISLLLVLLLVEARAQKGYQQSLEKFQDALEDQEREFVVLDDARKMMAYFPSESGPEESEGGETYNFSWFSILKSGQYSISVVAVPDENYRITRFATANSPMENVSRRSGEGGDDDGGFEEEGGFGGQGGFGGGNRQPPSDPVVTALDGDGDGELSMEEIENATDALMKLDTDGDGGISLGELFPDGPPGQGSPGGGGIGFGSAGPLELPDDLPRRPEIDDE